MTAVKNNEGRQSPSDFFMEQLEKAKKNRSINAQSSIEKQTPLMIAAQNGLVVITHLLINAGANPVIPDAKGHNSFWYAQHSQKDFHTIQNIVEFLKSSERNKPTNP